MGLWWEIRVQQEIRGVIHDSDCLIILSFLGLVGLSSVNRAEMLALRTCLCEPSSLNFQPIKVEGDSTFAIRWALGQCEAPRHLADIW